MISNLLSNQEKAITHLHTKKVGALFKAPGTGKTRTAIELINQTEVDIVVWFGPLSTLNDTKSGVKYELQKWTTIDKYLFVGIESIGMSDRIYLDLLNKIQGKSIFLVCDESILIKNINAKRTIRLLSISEKAEYKLILNGTPFSRDLMDLYSQMEFLSPKILNMSYAQFYNTFCRVKKTYVNGRLKDEFIIGYENIDYLYHLIRPFIYEAELVLDVNCQHIELEYQITNKEEYEEIRDYYLELMEEMENNIFLAMVQKMQQSYCDSDRKIGLLKHVIKEHGVENIAIYTKFIKSREVILKEIPEAKVYSLQSESLGLNLQEECNVTVEFDKTWDWKNVEQYKRRVFRTGQNRKVYHYYLTATNIGLDRLISANNDKKYSALEYFKSVSNGENIQQIKERL